MSFRFDQANKKKSVICTLSVYSQTCIKRTVGKVWKILPLITVYLCMFFPGKEIGNNELKLLIRPQQ